MKTTFTLLLIFTLTGFIAAAQEEYYDAGRTASVSTPHWSLKTNPGTGNTLILFFDQYGKIIYEETLEKRYVKLTKRNIRQFDLTLQQLIKRDLMASRLKMIDIPTIQPDLKEYTHSLISQNDAPVSEQSLKTYVYVTKEGRLGVFLQNCCEEKVTLQLLDSENRSIFEESTKMLKYGRYLNLTKLSTGAYELLVKSDKQLMGYKIMIAAATNYKVLSF